MGEAVAITLAGFLLSLFLDPDDSSANFYQTTRRHIPEDSTLKILL
jgi:hypothetical protein